MSELRRGRAGGADEVRRRRSDQFSGSGIGTRGTVRHVDGDLEVAFDEETLERTPDGKLRVKDRLRRKVAPLVDLTESLAVPADDLEAFPDTDNTAATIADLADDLNANVLPVLRAQISALAAKINEMLEAE